MAVILCDPAGGDRCDCAVYREWAALFCGGGWGAAVSAVSDALEHGSDYSGGGRWACLVYYGEFIYWLTQRTSLEIRGVIRWRIFGGAFFDGGGVGVHRGDRIIKEYNDLLRREDYKNITPDYEVRDAIFPPVNWGFDDAEFPHRRRAIAVPGSESYASVGDGRIQSRHAIATPVVGADRFWNRADQPGDRVRDRRDVWGGDGVFRGNGGYSRSRFIELVESMPTLFLIITFVAIFGRDILMIMVIIGVTGWTGLARFVRADFLRLRHLDYVHSCQGGGPAAAEHFVSTYFAQRSDAGAGECDIWDCGAITIESGLSYLGLGVEPPTPSWGSMLNEAGNPADIFHFWLALAPGMMIFLTIFRL